MQPKPAFETEYLPPVVVASDALAGDQITPAEYNLALRVAELKPYYETIWAAIRPGDTVLMPWPNGRRKIATTKALITNVGQKTRDGRTLVLAFYRIDGLGMRQEFDGEENVFIQSRV